MGLSAVSVASGKDTEVLHQEAQIFLDLANQGKYDAPPGETTTGFEYELVCIDDEGNLDLSAVDKVTALDSKTEGNFSITTEFGRHNVEVNGMVRDITDPFCFQRMIEDQRDALLHIDSLDLKPFGCGLVLNASYRDLGEGDREFNRVQMQSLINPYVPRYQSLLECWEAKNKGSKTIRFKGLEPFIIRSCALESLIASFQIHLSVNADQVADALNIASFIHAPTQAPFVCSPRIFGRTSQYQDLRAQIWRQLFPKRTGVGMHWYRDLEHLIKSSCKVEPWFEAERKSPEELSVLKTLLGSIWWDHRLKINGNRFTIEERAKGSGTPVDNAMKAVFWNGLMLYYLNNQRDAWRRFGKFNICGSNALVAAENGPSGKIVWFGEEVSLKKLILDELIPLAEKGLAIVTDTTATTLLHSLYNIVDKNKTVAEMIRSWTRESEGDLGFDRQIMKRLYELRDTSVEYWDY